MNEGTNLSRVSRLKYAYLAYLAKPKSDRGLYRQVKRQRSVRIVEVGLQQILRARRLIQVAQRFVSQEKVCYTGIDLFEARAGGQEVLSLIEAYRSLAPTGAQVRLLPGAAGSTLSANANSLLRTDLLLLNSDITDADMGSAWSFIPRMLHPRSLVLRERLHEGIVSWDPMTIEEILAAANPPKWRKAA